jgi:hypothetical protein
VSDIARDTIPTLAGCSNNKARKSKPATSSQQSTSGLPKALTPRTYKKQRSYWRSRAEATRNLQERIATGLYFHTWTPLFAEQWPRSGKQETVARRRPAGSGGHTLAGPDGLCRVTPQHFCGPGVQWKKQVELPASVRSPRGFHPNQAGRRSAKTSKTSQRRSCLRTATFPRSSVPWTWKTRFAKSRPLAVTCLWGAPLG